MLHKAEVPAAKSDYGNLPEAIPVPPPATRPHNKELSPLSTKKTTFAAVQKTASTLKNIAIFASGTGSNAQKIIDHFRHSDKARVALIVCNKPGAGILQIAEREGIESIIIEKEKFFHSDTYVQLLQQLPADLIVLAGFLWKVPANLVQAFPDRIINIHPALLPKYGGKGMYGHFVHEAVVNAGEKESGITIHYVNEKYDDGEAILQERCTITPDDTPESVARKVLTLEHHWYPIIVERLLS